MLIRYILCLLFRLLDCYSSGLLKKVICSNRGDIPETFRLSIKCYSDESIRIGLQVSDQLSGEDISKIFMSALPVIGKKNPDILRLLFLHSLDAFEGDAQMSLILKSFCERINRETAN